MRVLKGKIVLSKPDDWILTLGEERCRKIKCKLKGRYSKVKKKTF